MVSSDFVSVKSETFRLKSVLLNKWRAPPSADDSFIYPGEPSSDGDTEGQKLMRSEVDASVELLRKTSDPETPPHPPPPSSLLLQGETSDAGTLIKEQPFLLSPLTNNVSHFTAAVGGPTGGIEPATLQLL